MTRTRSPRKSLTPAQLKQAREELAKVAPMTAFDERELRAVKKYANWLEHRVATLELAMNKETRYSKAVVRKILDFAGEVKLV